MFGDPVTIGVLIDGASKLPALIGAGKGVYSLYQSFTGLNYIGKIRESLQSNQKILETAKYKPTEEEFLDFWLNQTSLFAPFLKQKIVTRFVLALLTIIVTQVAADVSRALTDQDTFISIAQAIIQISSGFIVKPDSFFDKEEKQFLTNMTTLQTMFYNSFVRLGMESFNKKLEATTSEPIFGKEKWRQTWGPIIDKFIKARQENELFMKGIKNNLENKQSTANRYRIKKKIK